MTYCVAHCCCVAFGVGRPGTKGGSVFTYISCRGQLLSNRKVAAMLWEYGLNIGLDGSGRQKCNNRKHATDYPLKLDIYIYIF